MVDSSDGPGNVQDKSGVSFTARKQGSAKKPQIHNDKGISEEHKSQAKAPNSQRWKHLSNRKNNVAVDNNLK